MSNREDLTITKSWLHDSRDAIINASHSFESGESPELMRLIDVAELAIMAACNAVEKELKRTAE